MFGMLKYAIPIAATLVLGASSGQAGVAAAAKAQANAFDGGSLATQVHYRKKKHWRHSHRYHKRRHYAYRHYRHDPYFDYWGPPVVYYYAPRRHHYWGGPSLVYRRSTYWYYDDCWPGRWCY